MASQYNKGFEDERGKYLFPATWFSEINTQDQQLNHIYSEFTEVVKAKSVHEKVMETLDLIHSAETYLRMLEEELNEEGVSLEEAISNIIKKNEQRGYYIRKMHCFGTWEELSKTCYECGDKECKEYASKQWQKWDRRD